MCVHKSKYSYNIYIYIVFLTKFQGGFGVANWLTAKWRGVHARVCATRSHPRCITRNVSGSNQMPGLLWAQPRINDRETLQSCMAYILLRSFISRWLPVMRSKVNSIWSLLTTGSSIAWLCTCITMVRSFLLFQETVLHDQKQDRVKQVSCACPEWRHSIYIICYSLTS
jgi:hypothetical protein